MTKRHEEGAGERDRQTQVHNTQTHIRVNARKRQRQIPRGVSKRKTRPRERRKLVQRTER